MKGATDGGLDIPHNDRRYPGAKKEAGEVVAQPDVLRKYIFGGHVADYMRHLQEEDEERYNKQFKRYIDAGVSADDLGGIYTKAHAAIRADPNKKRTGTELGRFKTRPKAKAGEPQKKRWGKAGLNLAQRKGRIKQKLQHMGIAPITV